MESEAAAVGDGSLCSCARPHADETLAKLLHLTVPISACAQDVLVPGGMELAPWAGGLLEPLCAAAHLKALKSAHLVLKVPVQMAGRL